jgi:hypothetical protein
LADYTFQFIPAVYVFLVLCHAPLFSNQPGNYVVAVYRWSAVLSAILYWLGVFSLWLGKENELLQDSEQRFVTAINAFMLIDAGSLTLSAFSLAMIIRVFGAKFIAITAICGPGTALLVSLIERERIYIKRKHE